MKVLPFYQLLETRDDEEGHLTDSFHQGEVVIQLQPDIVFISQDFLGIPIDEDFENFTQEILEAKKFERIQNLKLKRISSILIYISNVGLQKYLIKNPRIQILMDIYRKHKILFYLPTNRFLMGSNFHPQKGTLRKRLHEIFEKEKRNLRSFAHSLHQIELNHSFKLRFITEIFDFRLKNVKELVSYLQGQSAVNSYFNELYLMTLKDLTDREILKISNETFSTLEENLQHNYRLEDFKDDLKRYQKESENNSNSSQLLLTAMKEKPSMLNKVISASHKLNRIEKPKENDTIKQEFSDEFVIGGVQSQLRLKNAKYRSNASMRSGKILLTDQRLIAYHKKLSFLPMIPYFAYVRLNNRMIFIIQQIASFLGALKSLTSGLIRATGPALVAVFFGLFSNIKSIHLPSFLRPVLKIPLIKFFINLSVDNPRLLATTVSVAGGFSYGFIKLFRMLFYRSRSISVITYSMIQGISSQNKYFRTRNQGPVLLLKPKGSDIYPGLKSGLPFRMRLRSANFGGVPGYLQDELFALKLGVIPFL